MTDRDLARWANLAREVKVWTTTDHVSEAAVTLAYAVEALLEGRGQTPPKDRHFWDHATQTLRRWDADTRSWVQFEGERGWVKVPDCTP